MGPCLLAKARNCCLGPLKGSGICDLDAHPWPWSGWPTGGSRAAHGDQERDHLSLPEGGGGGGQHQAL